jgi:hypothetical protein
VLESAQGAFALYLAAGKGHDPAPTATTDSVVEAIRPAKCQSLRTSTLLGPATRFLKSALSRWLTYVGHWLIKRIFDLPRSNHHNT